MPRKKKVIETELPKKPDIKALFSKDNIFTENSPAARELYNLNRFGDLKEDGRVQLSLLEMIYLFTKGKILVVNGREKELTRDQIWKQARKIDANLFIRFCVFKDLRDRGYIVKTALKFGADFRVYDRGVKPGEDHAKWVVFPVHENNTMTWYEFSAKNRVAHSTKKRLLLAIVDDEGDCVFYETRWLKP